MSGCEFGRNSVQYSCDFPVLPHVTEQTARSTNDYKWRVFPKRHCVYVHTTTLRAPCINVFCYLRHLILFPFPMVITEEDGKK